MNEAGKRPYVGRITSVIVLIGVWSLAILARLALLQIVHHEKFVQLAHQRQQTTRAVLAPRGVIYDCHMDGLATSVAVSTVVVESKKIQDKARAAERLAPILEMDPADLLARLNDPGKQSFQILKRRIDPKDEPRIEALGISGVYFQDESMRVYPNRSLASHTLGFVNYNGDGAAGLELQYDRELKGREGQISFNVDARRRSFRGTMVKEPAQGHSLVLSLDKSIQFIADRELEAGVRRARARSGVAIVMESDTGRILALSNYPDFNCNAYGDYPMDLWRNKAVSDMFEPGSTFKVVVAAAALDLGLTREDERIDCQMGSMAIGKHVFHDHKPYGLLTFGEILEHSSNVGAAKLGMRLGEQRLYEALRNFGFGSRTDLDLPGEIAGLVRDWKRWSALSIGAISFGQEIGVTPMQILVAVNAIANGGNRVRPYLVDRVIAHNRELVRAGEPAVTRIMRPETAGTVTAAFEGVVLRGTGKSAALEGYRAAGKTGTAQKIENGRYSNTKYVASFIGFAPLPNPKITVLILIDEPRGQIYGGEVAAPVFKRIAQDTLLQMRVPPDKTVPLRRVDPILTAQGFEDFLPNATPIIPLTTASAGQPAEESDGVITVRVSAEKVVMPDLRGLPKRKVVNLCRELGLQIQSSGSGIALYQLPQPGAEVPLGDTCSVTFGRGNQLPVRAVPGLQAGVIPPRSEPVQELATPRP